MRKTKKKILLVGGGLTLFFVLVFVVAMLFFLLDKPLVKNILQNYVSKKFGMKLVIGKLDYDLFPLRIEAFSVHIAQKTELLQTDVELDRISMKGSLRKAMKKTKPFLDVVEVENVSVHIYQEIVKKKDFRNPSPFLSSQLDFVAEAKMKNVSFSYNSPSQAASFSSDYLYVSEAGQKGQRRFDFTGIRVDYQDIKADASFRCMLDAKSTLVFSDISVFEGDFSFSKLEATLSGKRTAFDSLDLAIRGEYEQGGKVVSLTSFEVKIPSLLEATGAGRAEFVQGVSLIVDSDVFVEDIEKSLHFINPFLPQKIEGLSLKGQAEIKGKCSIFSASTGRTPEFSGTIKLLPARVSYAIPGLAFDSDIDGEFKAEGSRSNIEYSGLLRLNKGILARENIKVQGLSLQLPFSGSGPAVKSGPFKGAMESFIFTSGPQSTALDAVDFEGKGSFDAGSMNLILNSLDVRALSLPSLHIEAKAGLKPEQEKQAKIEAANFDVVQIRSLLSFYIPKRFVDWKFDGRGSLGLEVQLSPHKENKIWNVRGELDLSEVLFQNPDFSLAGEELRPSISWEGKYSTISEQLEFSLFFTLDHGESLWKDRYVSWSENPIRGDIAGVFRIPQNEVKIHSLDVHFLPYGNTTVTGTVKIDEPFSLDLKGALSLTLEAFNGGFFGFRPFGQDEIQVMGETKTDFHLTAKNKSLKLSGELLIEEGKLENQMSHISVQGIEAKIPFDFETNGGENQEERTSVSENGYFLAQTLETPYFGIQPFELKISSRKNKFLIEPFSIELFGGTADFGASFLSVDPARLEVSGISSLHLEELDISRFPIESKEFKFEGSAKGNFPHIELTAQIISMQGIGECNIFDGQALFENIKILSPFVKSRTISADIAFENIDLEKMTDSIPFGKVTGILRGEIMGLAFSYGQPESFTLRLESVKTKGVPQLFSLKAVNDLTVLSSGEKSGIPALKGLARIMPSFPYKKIGISSSLENDIFTLRGIILEKGTEYLVKRSWLNGISVINRNPNKKISFKDMKDRLKRIGKSSESK